MIQGPKIVGPFGKSFLATCLVDASPETPFRRSSLCRSISPADRTVNYDGKTRCTRSDFRKNGVLPLLITAGPRMPILFNYHTTLIKSRRSRRRASAILFVCVSGRRRLWRAGRSVGTCSRALLLEPPEGKMKNRFFFLVFYIRVLYAVAL